MPSAQRRAVVVIAWLVLGILGAAPLASEATVLATYRFNDTLAADEPGRPALIAIDPLVTSFFQTSEVFGQSRRVYRFNGNAAPANQQAGLLLATTGLTSPTRYSVEMVFAFEEPTGWRRVLDVENRVSDRGIYVTPNNELDIFLADDDQARGAPTFTSGFHHVVIVVDAGTVKGYLDGTLQFTFETAAMNLDNPNNAPRLITLFLDNTSGGTVDEYSDGRVALIRLHDGAVTDAEVVQLFHELQGLPSLTVVLNDTALVPEETLTLTAVLAPGTTATLVDAYIVLQLPTGAIVSLVPGGVAPGVVPIASSFTPTAVSGQVFAYTFTGAEPDGPYLVAAGLTRAGTSSVIGALQLSVFFFSP